MSLYPSLEDMMVDQMAKVIQVPCLKLTRKIIHLSSQAQQSVTPAVSAIPRQVEVAALPYPVTASSAYPGLAEYMGLELTEDIIRANMPEYLPSNQVSNTTSSALSKNFLCLQFSN